ADEVNTYAHQAEILASVVASAVGGEDRPVFLVGHSIGGMIGLELAARQPDWCLVGLAISGMGAQLSDSGLGEQLGAISGSGLAELPGELRKQIFYGPETTVSGDVVAAAGICYAPAPIVELRAAARWAFDRLDEVAAAVSIPVHHALGEYDSIWDVSDGALVAFTSRFRPEVSIRSEVVRRAGHSIDHHRVGATLHHRQLGFAHCCAVA
ncbi:MAG: hypothetical protein K0Q61_4188, partial [Rhodococcus erythropolis]|nr:hypothetical protein [Rhodococcus erythropolis]